MASTRIPQHPLQTSRLILAAALLWGSFATAALSQKPPVPVSDYGKFERLGWQQALSPDGGWVAYEVNRVDGSHELRARATGEGAETRVLANGRAPVFSADARQLAWRIELPQKEKDQLDDPDSARTGMGLLTLGDDEEQAIEEVASFAFDESGRFLAVLGFAPKEPEGKGADLRVLDLEAGSETTFGNVSAMAWSETGSLLALATTTGRDAGNGLQVLDAATGVLRGLDASGSKYLSPTWRTDAADLAVLRTLAPATTEDADAAELLAWRGLASPSPGRFELGADAAPERLEIVVHRKPTWAEVGARVAVGLRPCDVEEGCARDAAEEDAAEEPEADSSDDDQAEADSEGDGEGEGQGEAGDGESKGEDAEEPKLPGLQIWHAKDRRLYPEQKVSANRDERRTLAAVWNLDSDSLVQIGTDLKAGVTFLGEDWHGALESTDAPYAFGAMFGRPYVDVFKVDVSNGARQLLAGKVRYRQTSPEGRWLLTFDGRDWWADEIATGDRRNLTERLGVDFARTDYDTPTDQLPPYGDGGWLEDDAGVLLYDEFDVWLVDPESGRGRRLTDGRPTRLIYRVVDLDPEEEAHDPSAGLHFLLRNEATEQRGLARIADLSSGATASARAEIQQLGDYRIGSLRKADDTDALVYVRQSRTESPNLFLTDIEGATPRQLSDTNPFLGDYAWTRSELVDFTSEQGRELQAALLYPVNHDPARRYPMIVYTYEILAPQIHTFDVPDERRYYNYAAWTQAGYFVIMPDIVYTAREPGPSALASVRAAVKSITDRGLVDPERVGLIGHSWGGYQATYLPTRTDIFAASVAGAPLTDFVSFMGQLHWNPGIAELTHWETGQARMEVPFWEDPEAHRRSSPIHEVHNMKTPLLMAFGNEDGVVDWDQGTEFFNFARRAEKQMVLLVYEGEDHGFREEANQKDYHRRILEWFGHYLKGEEAPRWITEGIAFDELEDEKKRVAGDG